MPTEKSPLACEVCGSVGAPLSGPSTESTAGSLVIGLDAECEGCQTLAQESGIVFFPRFDQPYE